MNLGYKLLNASVKNISWVLVSIKENQDLQKEMTPELSPKR